MLSPPLVKETCLYVSDLTRAVKFYRELFGFEVMESDSRFAALNVADQHVLLLFVSGASTSPTKLPGGVIPAHDGSGPMHIGFSVTKDELEQWEKLLKERDIAIESRVSWPRGGKSIYFRDPDGHALELLTTGVWFIY